MFIPLLLSQANSETATKAVKEAVKATAEKLPPVQEAMNLLFNGKFGEITTEQWWLIGTSVAMRVGLVLILLFLALTIASWVGGLVRLSLSRMKVDQTLSKFAAKLARWSILVLAVLVCLDTFGVGITSFAAVLGAAGFAVGLAFQGTLSNFAAGAMLLVFRPFKVGDVVEVGGELGIVDEIELFTTAMDTFDNRRIIIPNSSVFGSTIENITYHSLRRVDVAVGTAYEADIDQTRATLEYAIQQTEGGLTDPAPQVVLDGLGASSVDWQVRVWAPTDKFLDVKQSLTRSVKIHLDQAGIGIPYPQMDVHLPNQEAA